MRVLLKISQSSWFYLCVCVFVCVEGGERERESFCVSMCVCGCVCVCLCVCVGKVCVCWGVFTRERVMVYNVMGVLIWFNTHIEDVASHSGESLFLMLLAGIVCTCFLSSSLL